MGDVIKLTKRQKSCRHKVLKVQVSEERYFKYMKWNNRVEIVCADCELCISRAGTIYINRRMAILGIIDEHWSNLLLEEGMKI